MFQLHKCKVKRENVKLCIDEDTYATYNKRISKAANRMFTDVTQVSVSKLMDKFEMQLHMNGFSLYIVEIEIQQKRYRFILDTGAQVSGILSTHQQLISATLIDTKIDVKSVGGTIKKLDTILLKEYFVGGLKINNHTLVVLDDNDFNKHKFMNHMMKFDGILGWDILQHIDFEIDAKHARFKILKILDKQVNRNMIVSKLPLVLVSGKDERLTLFGIDSGASSSWLNETYTKNANYTLGNIKKTHQLGVFGLEKMNTQFVRDSQYHFYHHKISLAYTRIADTEVLCKYHLDGMFGNEIFDKKRIQFINSKGVVRILD